MSALSAMQEKNSHLENSLSAETRLKLDLFSALGDTKRQLEISQGLLIPFPCLRMLIDSGICSCFSDDGEKG